MSKYLEEKLELDAAEKRIREKRGELLTRRKNDVASLLERLGDNILALPDDLIAGILLDAHSTVTVQRERAEELAVLGARFLKGKKSTAKAIKETAGTA